MHQVIRTLGKVADRYAPSRILSFEMVHVFKALQLMEKNKINRALLVKELRLGEGSIKTLVKHMKMKNLIETSNAGMWLTGKGKTLFSKINEIIPAEIKIPECSVTMGKYNQAILVKNLAKDVGTGIEQRDAVIKIGALGATTLVFRDNKLFTSDKNYDIPIKDEKLITIIIKKLRPENDDVIIIASAQNKETADLAVKRAALETISNHEKHST